MAIERAVTETAAMHRIKRKLKTEGQIVKSGCDRNPGMGKFWVCDQHTGTIEWGFDDIEATARDLGCVKPYEKVRATATA